MPKLANGEDPVASLPNPEAENAEDDVCGKTLAVGIFGEFAVSSVAGCKSAVDEEFCLRIR